MPSIDIIILSIGAIIFISHIFKSIFEKTKIPDVLLLILLGIGITLSGFDASSFHSVGDILFEIALALILFEAGIHLKFHSLYQSMKSSSFLILATFALTIFFIFLISKYLFFLSFLDSIVLGIIMASISPAVVIPLVEKINISEKIKSSAIVEATLTDVLSIFLVISIIHDPGSDIFNISEFSKSLLFLILKSCAVGFAASVIWSFIFIKLRNFPNTIFTSIAFILILFGISHTIEASAPITVLIFSMIISLPSESKARTYLQKIKIKLIEFSPTEKTLYSEVIFIVKTFFFVYLGMKMSSFDFNLDILFVFLKSLLLTVAAFLARYLILFLFKRNGDDNNLLLALIPKGLAAAVLISMYIKEPNDELILLTYGVILNSIFISSILIYFHEKGKILFFKGSRSDLNTLLDESDEIKGMSDEGSSLNNDNSKNDSERVR